MGLETGTYISDLNSSNPAATDPKSQGDDHIRLLKSTIKATFPNVSGAVTPTHTELNYVDGVTSAIQSQLDGKATTAQGAKADTAVQSVNSKTGTSITLTKSDVGLSNVDNTSDANKPISTATQSALDAKAPLASPALTGTPTAPTAATGTSTTQIATTAFVQSAAFNAALPAQTGNAGKYVTTDGTNASWAEVVSASTQEFTSSGTWTKPAGAKFVMVEAWGAGGGGGSGRRGAAGSVRCGGGGGGGGAYASKLFKASDLAASVTVTIGAGGSGGAAITANDTSGSNGTNGGNSTFGSYLTAYGGGLGVGGSSSGSGASGGAGGGTQGAGVAATQGGPLISATGLGGNQAFGGGAAGNSTAINGGASGFGGGGGGGSLNGYNSGAAGSSSWGGAGGPGGGTIPSSNDGTAAGVAGSGYFGAGSSGGAANAKANMAGYGLAYGNGMFVQNDAGWVATSSDGSTWAFARTNLNVILTKIIWTGSQWVGLASNGVYTSSNLTTWTLQSAPVNASSIALYGGTYVVVGVSGSIKTSTDLVNWTSRTSGTSETLRDVIHDGTRWVVVGGTEAGGISVTSTDSVNWTAVTTAGSFLAFYGVASSGSVLVAVATVSPYAYRSTNGGASWSAVSTTLAASGSGAYVLYAGGSFVWAGASVVATSSDGDTWTTQTDGTPDSYRGIAYGGSQYFIASSNLNTTAGILSDTLTSWSQKTFTAYDAASGSGTNGPIGSGGGGGGGSLNGYNSGAGGAGGNGLVRVYTW